MRADLQCIPCSLRQALRSAILATEDIEDSEARKEICLTALKLSLRELSTVSLDHSPAELSTKAIKAALSALQVVDPYKRAKEEHTRLALSLYDELKDMVRRSDDSLRTSLKFAACGNVIDLGARDSFDIEGEIESSLSLDFARDEYQVFRQRLSQAKRILYIADNAGEIVFDRFVLEEMSGEVTVAVKSGPILNDATMEDALSSELGDAVKLIATGTDELGVSTERCSAQFRESFDNSDLIIAKGHANFETLDEQPKEIFFLLKAKCEVVARRLGVEIGDSVLTRVKRGL